MRVIRDGHVVREVVLRSLPASIGRASDVDLPLLDPSVSRKHAQIEIDAEGQAWLVDLGSQNGLQVQGAYVERVPLRALVRCRLGQVELELEPFEATPTVTRPRLALAASSERAALHPLLVIALGLLAVASEAALDSSFWSPTQEGRAVLVAGILLGVALFLPLVATIWFVILKVLGRHLRWAHALQALALLLWIRPVLSVVDLVGYYLLSARAAHTLDGALTLAASVVAVVVMVGVRRPPPQRLFRLAWGVGTLLALVAIRSIAALSAQRQGEPALDFRVEAPLGSWPGVTQPMQTYEARVRAMAAEAQRAAEEVRITQQRD